MFDTVAGARPVAAAMPDWVGSPASSTASSTRRRFASRSPAGDPGPAAFIR